MPDLDQIICGFDLWHIEVPVVSRRDHGIGAVDGSIEMIILRLTAEDGSQGWGEASCWSVFTGTPEASFAALDRYIRPLVLGRKLSERGQILEQARHVVAHATEAKAALEAALLDLIGRISGLPVWALLGGRVRDRVPLSVSIANPDFDADIALMERLREDRVPLVKLKAGFRDHGFDMMRCDYIRQHFPEFGLRVDYNQGLGVDEALSCVLGVAAFQPDFIEQPVAAHHYDLMAEIRRLCPVPLLADESIFGPEDMIRAAREGIADGVSVKIMKAGGLARAQRVAQIAHLNGWSAYGGDMHETGLAHLAGLHMVAATPEITLGCEFYHASYYVEQDILTEPFPVQDGHVIVPQEPGLGRVPDMDLLTHLQRSA